MSGYNFRTLPDKEFDYTYRMDSLKSDLARKLLLNREMFVNNHLNKGFRGFNYSEELEESVALYYGLKKIIRKINKQVPMTKSYKQRYLESVKQIHNAYYDLTPLNNIRFKKKPEYYTEIDITNQAYKLSVINLLSLFLCMDKDDIINRINNCRNGLNYYYRYYINIDYPGIDKIHLYSKSGKKLQRPPVILDQYILIKIIDDLRLIIFNKKSHLIQP